MSSGLLRPTTTSLAVLGPTQTLATHIFQTGFVLDETHYASAVALVLFVLPLAAHAEGVLGLTTAFLFVVIQRIWLSGGHKAPARRLVAAPPGASPPG